MDLFLGEILENNYKICQRKDYKTVYSNVNYTPPSSKNVCAILKTIQELLKAVSGLLRISTFKEENPKPIIGKRY